MGTTPIAQMVVAMIARGVDPDMIELAVSTAEAVAAAALSGGIPPDTTAAKRRAWDRDRKQRKRDVHRNSTGIPPDANVPLSIRKKEVIKQEEEREAPQRAVHPTKRGHRLPDDWRPRPDDLTEAMRRLGGPFAAEQELLKFHDYWKAQPGQRAVKLDWDATWRNWIRNAKGASNGRRTIHEAAADLTRQLELVEQINAPAPVLREPEGRAVIQLLPPR